ncbi:MAG TPA: hypothetical protein VH165_19330 [Kofleriaceae bacterium]|jgi:hypothetical protein|nr:hypothetical protein [Kofleriaceae bacterium]
MVVALMAAADRAAADMVPEDPYVDHRPGSAPVAAPAATVSPPHSVTATQAVNPEVSMLEMHGWELAASGSALLAFAWLVWRHRRNARRQADLAKRRTQFHMSAIDPSVANNHVAAWERAQRTPIAPPAGSPAQPPRMAVHGYGPYGQVAPRPALMAGPNATIAVPHNAAAAYNPAPHDALPVAPYPSPPTGLPVLPAPRLQVGRPPYHAVRLEIDRMVDLDRTLFDASCQARVEHAHASQLARGSQPEKLEQTRRLLRLASEPVSSLEAPSMRASRLRHPPVPRPAHVVMSGHIPAAVRDLGTKSPRT